MSCVLLGNSAVNVIHLNKEGKMIVCSDVLLLWYLFIMKIMYYVYK